MKWFAAILLLTMVSYASTQDLRLINPTYVRAGVPATFRVTAARPQHYTPRGFRVLASLSTHPGWVMPHGFPYIPIVIRLRPDALFAHTIMLLPQTGTLKLIVPRKGQLGYALQATFRINIPNRYDLIGKRFYLQAILLTDPGGIWLSGSMQITNPVEVWIHP